MQRFSEKLRRRLNGSGARGGRTAHVALTGFVIGMSLLFFSPRDTAGHIFIFESQRAGIVDQCPGTGWVVECYYPIPDEFTETILDAEEYVAKMPPTFTFHADYIDWPAGDTVNKLDSELPTLGDFFDGYITDVSDPEAMDLSMDHFLIKATGYLNAQITDSSNQPAPPVWIEFGLSSFDGGRVRIEDTTIFRIIVPVPPYGFFTENAIIDLPGAYPIEITYFQKYDPEGKAGAELAGVELYACNPEGLELTLGDLVLCYDDSIGRALPPSLIHQEEDLLSPIFGDFDTDTDIDLVDFGYFQRCFTGDDFDGFLENGCDAFDADFDEDIDLVDYLIFSLGFNGPATCEEEGSNE